MPDPTLTTLSSIVKPELAGKNLLDYLCARFPYKDREAWRDEIKLGRLTVNDKVPNPKERLGKGAKVSYTSQRNEPPVARDIPTLWEDEHLLVVNKPAPLPVHSDGVFITNTLINILRQRTGNAELGLGHRLDRETSGVLVLAKTRPMIAKIMAAFDDHSLEKWYLAVGRGTAGFKETMIKGGMGKAAESKIDLRQKMFDSNAPGTKDSITRFMVKEQLQGYVLLACNPLTGRTNQIRVHLEALGLPLAGDKLYGRTDDEYLGFIAHVKAGGDQGMAGKLDAPRHMLHAWKLSLKHPVTGERMSWEAPMPGDMQEFIKVHRGA